jgi:riboflavin kinase
MAGQAELSVGHDELATLKRLAMAGALETRATVTCAALAGELDVSNQTASRRLQRLEDAGLVEREIVSDGQRVAITEAGERSLQREYADYRRIFEGEVGVSLSGTVTSGMGEGRHYISLPGYMEQFEERLGYTPFAGTLNVELDDDSVRSRARMDTLDPVPIDGWEDEDRTYGPAFCWPATLETPDGERYEDAHVIAPERTHHGADQLEVIAPAKLRDALGLDDEDHLSVQVGERGGTTGGDR